MPARVLCFVLLVSRVLAGVAAETPVRNIPTKEELDAAKNSAGRQLVYAKYVANARKHAHQACVETYELGKITKEVVDDAAASLLAAEKQMAGLRAGKPVSEPIPKVTPEVYRVTLDGLTEAEEQAYQRFEAGVASKLEWLEAQRRRARWQWQFGPIATRDESATEVKKVAAEELEIVGKIRAAAFGGINSVDIYDLHRDLIQVSPADVARQRQLLEQEVERNHKSLQVRYDRGVIDSIDYYSGLAEGLQILLEAETLPTTK